MRSIFLVIGILLLVLASAMLLPLAIDLFLGSNNWRAFAISSFITAFIGGGLVVSHTGETNRELTIKHTFILTVMSWLSLVVFACVPFMLADIHASITDAFFETMSALTTTGATTFSGLDEMSKGILFWRSLLQWMGGVGIIVMAMAILPMLNVGGMQLFRTESSDKSEKILPKITQICGAIAGVYLFFTTCCFISLMLVGMGMFDALCHAMTTIATSGFSTHDASIGHFNSWKVELVIICGMIVSGIPYLHYIQAARGRHFALFTDRQVHVYLAIIFGAVFLVWQWLDNVMYMPTLEALRIASFNVVSLSTTTGFSTVDYNLWGSFAFILLFLITVVGGCTGSTTGGIKIFRLMVLFKTARVQLRQLAQPHGVFRPKYNDKPISDEAMRSVMSFFFLFAACFCALALTLGALGLDYVTSLSAAASMMANLGPGLGEIIGPTGNYEPLSNAVKWVLAAGMLVGRLEIFTVLILFSPYFWKN